MGSAAAAVRSLVAVEALVTAATVAAAAAAPTAAVDAPGMTVDGMGAGRGDPRVEWGAADRRPAGGAAADWGGAAMRGGVAGPPPAHDAMDCVPRGGVAAAAGAGGGASPAAPSPVEQSVTRRLSFETPTSADGGGRVPAARDARGGAAGSEEDGPGDAGVGSRRGAR